MQKNQSDQELNLKKKARRRLVGAIALVLLMIFILPLIMKDRVAQTPEEKIVITLPNDQPAAPAAGDFGSSVVPSDGAVSEPLPTAAAQPTEDTPPQEDVEKSVPAGAATVDVQEASKPQTVSKATEKPAEKAATVSGNGHFYVQVGVFSSAANVKQLQEKLSGLGYKTQTEKVATPKGEKIRLRTRSFDTRNEAAAALDKIKSAGLTGMVVSQ